MSEKQQPPSYPVPQGYPQGAPVGVAPNVVNVIPPANAGQQYRDQLFALCAQGQHERKTEYGVCGIITAIACFPIGLICLFMDTNVKCSRCGVSLPK
ncbi:hypothetical protein BYT27DRAFT_7262720 [Phlegmacium glaucopus]|nr:hypothetical protein BYT27DRAFT_7262720 [Phlegmacium glaucopus]